MKKIRTKTHSYIALCLAFILSVSVMSLPAAWAEEDLPTQSDLGYLDKLVFADGQSEQEHDFYSDASEIVTNATTEEKARKAMPTDPATWRAGDISFTMKVDPYLQNYFTVKVWGGDNALKSIVVVDGEAISFRDESDRMPLILGYNAPMAGRYYYSTVLLPLDSTHGKKEVTITIRTGSGDFSGTVRGNSRSAGFYNAYTHTQAYLDVSGETQGNAPAYSTSYPGGTARTDTAVRNEVVRYNTTQQNHFNAHRTTVDGGNPLAIRRYHDNLKQFAGFVQHGIFYDGDTLNTEKIADLERIFKTIDIYVSRYYTDVRTTGRNDHQSDWGGYFSPLGEALYMVQNQIFDDSIYGKAKFEELLQQPVAFNTAEGEYSLSSKDADGNPITRFEAWERCLKATYDFARSRLSYIYNQAMFTYEGAWKALEGLNVIGSPIFEAEGGKAKSQCILRESLGIAPFLYEEILVGPNGEELDMYHDLFRHDTSLTVTEDCVNVVMKGLARSKLDENGEQIRARHLGDHYTVVSEGGFTRENQYVASYGEVGSQYFPEYFFKTLNQPGDEELNDDILKVALRNINARGYARFSVIAGNRRIIRMEQFLDERNSGWPGSNEYTGRRATLFPYASLEWHMANNEERYAGPEWDEYWEYAAKAVGFVQQMIVDNQFYDAINNNISTTSAEPNVIRRNYFFVETYDYLTGERANFDRFDSALANRVYPHTDFSLYSQDEILKMLGTEDTGAYDRFAWADVDTLYVTVKDEGVSLWANLMYQNRGFAGTGQMHVITKKDGKEYANLVQIATNNQFIYEGYTIRPSDRHRSFARFPASYANAADPFALTGEILPNAYRPGVGLVERENFNEDHGYSGYPDMSVSRYGKYFMLINTTRDVFENARSYTVELPGDFAGNSVLDLVSGEMITVVDSAVVVPPKTAYVLKLSEAVQSEFAPSHVDFVKAFAGADAEGAYAGILWKLASGGATYTVSRSETEEGEYAVIAAGLKGGYYEDRTVTTGKTYYYKVCAVNENGTGWISYRAILDWAGADTVSGWLDSALYDAKAGQVVVNGDSISITGASGTGLGAGEDFILALRDINDSLQFVSRLQTGSFEIQANVSGASGPLNGLMIREDLGSNSRYLYFGADRTGTLVLANRTKETRWNNSTGRGSSPASEPIGNLNIKDYSYLKLVRDASLHMIYAYASEDGVEWLLAGQMDTPMLQPVYAGVSSTGSAVFSGVAVRGFIPGTKPAPVALRADTSLTEDNDRNPYIDLAWSAPARVVAFTVERSVNGGDFETLVAEQARRNGVYGLYSQSYADTSSIAFGNVYTYRVTAIAQDGQRSEPSVVSLLTQPPSVIDVMSEAVAFNIPVPGIGPQSALTARQQAEKVFRFDTPVQGNNASQYMEIQQFSGIGGSVYLLVDFGEGKAVRIDRAKLFPRTDQAGRSFTTAVWGSNDNVSWTRITTAGINSSSWQTLTGIDPDTAYRYIKVDNNTVWWGNFCRLILYGDVVTDQPLAYVSTVPTPQNSDLINPDYDRSYDSYAVETNGFTHPGYVLTREDLNVMRDMVWLGKSPWKESFEQLMTSPYASVGYRTLGASQDLVGENQLYTMFQDMTASFYMAVMWYITGDQAYADRAIEILMDWSETCVKDSSRDLIRNGHGLQKAAMAAEILRYTPSSGWTEENTAKLTAFMKLLQPGVDRSNGYFNQGLYALSGWMGIAIFTNDASMYETAVERAVHNVQGAGTNFSFSSMLLDSGQIVELGRDFVHSVDDVRLLPIIAQALYAQGTRVKLEGSTVTVTPEGEDLYEFQNQKLLKAMAYISKHGLGQEVAWYRENGWGSTDVPFSGIAMDRAPFTGMMPAYNHYRYVKGYGPDDQRTDPYMTHADGRYQALYGGDTTYGVLYDPIETMADIGGMEGMEFDFLGCGDLFFTPWFIAGDAPGAGAPNRLPVVMDLYDEYIRQEGGIFDAAYCETEPGNPPSFESFTDEDGVARNNLANTHLYSWVAYEVDFTGRYGSTAEKLVDTFSMAHSHSGPVGASSAHNMILYVGPYVENPTVETFAAAKETTAVSGEIARNTYRNNGGFWTDYMIDSIRLSSENPALLTGKKTVYMYLTTSTSNYQLHTNVLWFKFSGGSAKNVDGNNPGDADVLSASGATKSDGGVTLTDGGYFGFHNFDFDRGFDAWSFAYEATGSGVLKLVTGAPDGGTPVKSMEIAATEGVLTSDFDHTGQISPRGLHDTYIVYEGEGSVTITSFRSRDGKVFMPHDGDSYRNTAYGRANKVGDGVAELSVIPDGPTRVGYYYIPFLEGPKTLNIRVKSDVAATLQFTMLSNINRTVALFGVPATTNMDDGWINMQYELSTTHSGLKADQNLMLTVTGSETGTVELDSWWLSYDIVEASVITVAPDLNDLVLFPGLQLTFAVTEKGGGAVTTGALPAGAGFADGTLTWTVTEADIGMGTIIFAASNAGGTTTYNLRYVVWESLEALLAESKALYDETLNYTIESRVRYLSALADAEKAVRQKVPYETILELINAFKARASELRVFEPTPEGLQDYIQLKDSIIFSVFHGLNTNIDGVTYNGLITNQNYILNTLNISKLMDNTANSYIEIRPRVAGAGETAADTRAQMTMDFGAGMGVILSKVEVQARQGQTGRTNGVLVRGSNDGINWVNLTAAFSNTAALQSRDVTDEAAYRYIRVINPGGTDANANNFLSIAEYHIYGAIVQKPTVTAADVANGIISVIAPVKDGTELEIPWVPEGFGIFLKSSSNKDVIDLNGAITPPTSDTEVDLVFSVIKNGAAESADTISIPVLVPGTNPPALELDVGVSTPTIVATLAANLAVTVEGGSDKALTAYLKVGDELLYATAVTDGKARMRVTTAPEAGTYELVVVGEGYTGSCDIKVVPYNTNIWNAGAYALEGRLLIQFNDDVILMSGTGCVTIKDGSYNARVLDDMRTVEVLEADASTLASGTAVSVKGVKYPALFPSYSFTFTVTVP